MLFMRRVSRLARHRRHPRVAFKLYVVATPTGRTCPTDPTYPTHLAHPTQRVSTKTFVDTPAHFRNTPEHAPGPALRRPDARRDAGLHNRCRPDGRARHRREHGDLLA